MAEVSAPTSALRANSEVSLMAFESPAVACEAWQLAAAIITA